MRALALLLALGAYAPQQAGSPLLDPPREARVQALGKKLRCPMCQGLSIADSNSSAARAQMDKVRELVAAGKSDTEILDYFVGRYGEWALLEPSARGMNWLVWLLPVLLLLGGGWAIARTLRRGPPSDSTVAEVGKTVGEVGKAQTDERPPGSGDPYLEAVRAELRR